ncbi:hypothetical protein [Streptomyces flaveolus]|uniref:hypothetical protein n=1 Tax=Streptomyces flaveolus TaxID=67297 RepID=UPI003F541B9D
MLRETDLIGLFGQWGRPLADAPGLVTFEIPLPLPAVDTGFARPRGTTPARPAPDCAAAYGN